MPTEDAYSSGHLVLSQFGTCKCSNVETNISWTCLVSGVLSFEHPSVLLFLLVFHCDINFAYACILTYNWSLDLLVNYPYTLLNFIEHVWLTNNRYICILVSSISMGHFEDADKYVSFAKSYRLCCFYGKYRNLIDWYLKQNDINVCITDHFAERHVRKAAEPKKILITNQ